MNASSSYGDRQKVWDLIKDIRVAMMTTLDGQGVMHARPMTAMQTEFDGTLWFMTRRESVKVDELAANPRVLLAYANPDDQEYVSISGSARVVEDREKARELWSEGARVWFPKGPDDPNLTLLAVEVNEAEYWDSQSSTMIYAYGYVKARLTGEPPSPNVIGENKKVGF